MANSIIDDQFAALAREVVMRKRAELQNTHMSAFRVEKLRELKRELEALKEAYGVVVTGEVADDVVRKAMQQLH